MSCNLHTGVRICLLRVVEEDLSLRNVAHAHMTVQETRHTLELLLREEEEFLKLQMYVRDERFHDLENDAGVRGQLHKIVLDILHCPMRTNEKVLTLLYEEVLQGAHKAQATIVLDELTPIIRRLGELGECGLINLRETVPKRSKNLSCRMTSRVKYLLFISLRVCVKQLMLRSRRRPKDYRTIG